MREIHPAANEFPMLDDAELEALTEDIRANGLITPITTWGDDGEIILDGRNRLKACEAAGVVPRFKEYQGDDPVGYIISSNIHRRHITKGQLAMILARLRPMGEQGKRSDLGETSGLNPEVDPTYIRKARTVLKADPQLAAEVQRGEISLPKAHRQIKETNKPEPKPPGKVTKKNPNGLVLKRPDFALQYASMAINDLEKIHDNDINRDDALKRVATWIKDNS